MFLEGGGDLPQVVDERRYIALLVADGYNVFELPWYAHEELAFAFNDFVAPLAGFDQHRWDSVFP